MSIIYETKGKAAEYCQWAVNLYRGCGHGCAYCYGPAATRTTFKDFMAPSPRVNVIERLIRDAEKLPVRPEIMLSFSCDPYQPLDGELQLTRRALEVLKGYGFPVRILTKGGLAPTRDFHLLGPDDWFGVTLTTLEYSYAWEPRAAPPSLRIEGLKIAREMGLKTWVSLEPVLYPEQTLTIIQRYAHLVDHWKVGKLNYAPHALTIDWPAFREQVTDMLLRVRADYYIKKSLEEA